MLSGNWLPPDRRLTSKANGEKHPAQGQGQFFQGPGAIFSRADFFLFWKPVVSIIGTLMLEINYEHRDFQIESPFYGLDN